MSIAFSVDGKIDAFGIHALAGLFVSFGVCVLAEKIKDYFFSQEKTNFSKYFAPGVGLLAGISASMWIASSPTAQKLAVDTITSRFPPRQGRFLHQELCNKAQIQLFSDLVRPHLSSLSSVFCGVAGAVLGCWAFHKLS